MKMRRRNGQSGAGGEYLEKKERKKEPGGED